MNDEIIQLRRYPSELDAVFAKNALEAEGIQAIVLSDDAGGMQPQLQFIQGVSLMVHRNDAARAREILDEIESGS